MVGFIFCDLFQKISANMRDGEGPLGDNTHHVCNEIQVSLRETVRLHFLDYGQQKDSLP